MKYKYVEEEREYKYGPQEVFSSLEEVKAHIRKVRNEALTNLVLAGYYKSIESITEVQEENSITLKIVIKYPVEIL